MENKQLTKKPTDITNEYHNHTEGGEESANLFFFPL